MNSSDCKLSENKIYEIVKTLRKDYRAEVLNRRNYIILTALLDLDECEIYMEDIKKFDLASTIIRFTKESNQIKKVSMRLMSKFCKAKSRGLNNQLIQKTKPKEIPEPIEPVETKPKEFPAPVDFSACMCEISVNSADNFKVLDIPDQAVGSALANSSNNDDELFDYAACETPAYQSDTEEGEMSDLENKDPDSWDSDDSNYKYSVLPGLEYLARPRKSEKNKEEAGQKVAVECVACPKLSENMKEETSKKITVRGGGGKLRAMAALLNIDLCKLDSNGKDSELRRKVAEESSSSEEDCDSDDSEDMYSVLPGLEHLKKKNEAKADHDKSNEEREEETSSSTVARQVNMDSDKMSASGNKIQKETADKPVKENKKAKNEEQKEEQKHRKRRGEPLSGDVVPRKRVRGEEKKKLYNHLKETGTVQRLF